MDNAVEIESLEIKRENATLFPPLTMSVKPGEKVVLSGPSGYGKSTLLRCLLGFVPIACGTIKIFGVELTPRSAWQLRSRMAYVDQEPALGEDTVEAFLRRPFSYKTNHRLSFDPERVATLMSLLHLPTAVQHQKVTSLSGGEKQRVALTGALLLKRDILLLDEPTSALNDDTAKAVTNLLAELKNVTVLAIAHDQFLGTAFDRVVDLQKTCARA